MIVNFHEHPKDGLVEKMAATGVDVSVLLPVGEENNARAESMAAADPGRFVPFFWPGYAEDFEGCAERFAAARERGGGRGVKFQLLLQHASPDDRRLYPMYEKCAEGRAPVLFHCGMVAFREELGRPHLSAYSNSVHGADRVAADFPELPIVIAHLGGNYHYEALVAAEKHPNVYLDTAFLHFFEKRALPRVSPVRLIERAVSILGPEKVLYGGEGVLPGVVRAAAIPEEDKAAILGGNAARLLGLA
ncbi:MAG: amidohydrolase family protein [Planctomycetota bacterium]|jgi:predicted TIM-barrel fold metal-dependent hydrolase